MYIIGGAPPKGLVNIISIIGQKMLYICDIEIVENLRLIYGARFVQVLSVFLCSLQADSSQCVLGHACSE